MGKVQLLSKSDLKQLSVVQESLEILDWWLYDTRTVATGGTAVSFTFFQQSVGQSGITLETTNLDIPGQLPSGHKMVAQKIVCEPLPSVLAAEVLSDASYVLDALAVTHVGNAVFNIGTRPYFQMPIKNLIGGNLQGFAAGAGAEAANQFLNYAQSRTVVNGEMEYSPVIPATYAFNVAFTYPSAPVLVADTKVRVQIIGKLIRPRQG